MLIDLLIIIIKTFYSMHFQIPWVLQQGNMRTFSLFSTYTSNKKKDNGNYLSDLCDTF